jgi:hypothetical protein
MLDFSQLLGLPGGNTQNDPTGLLTPQQQGDINQNTMMSIAAGLMKAGGPSPYKAKMTTLSGIGEALQGGLAARAQAQKDAITQSYVRTQMMDKFLPIMKEIRMYEEAGIEPPAQLTRMRTLMSNMIGGGAPVAPGAQAQAGASVVPPVPGSPTAPSLPAGGGGAVAPGTPAPAPGTPAPAPGTTADTSVVPRIMSMEEFARTHGFIQPGRPAYALMPDSPQHAALKDAYQKYQDAVSPERRASEEEKAVTAGDVAHYGNQYVGIQAARRAGEKVLGIVDQAKAVVDLMDKSGYKPGGIAGPELQLAWRRFAANTGLGDPNSAFSPEVFKKVTQEALQGIQEEASATAAEIKGAAGRNLLATVKLQLGSSPSTDITIPSNRYLLDQMATHAEHSVNMGTEATKYKAGNKFKRLDEGWDAKETELNAAHREAQLKRLQTQGLAGMTPTPSGTPAAGQQLSPGMFSPQGPGAPSGFNPITSGAPAAPGTPVVPGGAQAAPAQPAARPPMEIGRVYTRVEPDGSKTHIKLFPGETVPVPVDARGNKLGQK